MFHTTSLIVVFICATLLVACATTCESSARKEFQRQHPDYKIIDIHPDGNDTGVVLYIVSYKKPADEKTYFASIGSEDHKTGNCKVGDIDEYK